MRVNAVSAAVRMTVSHPLGTQPPDKDESGELDFTEFLVGLWNFLTFDEDAIIKLCFDM